MATSDNPATREIVMRALRAVASSVHPDVQHLGLDAIAALPANEAATLTDVVSGWLTPETATFQAAPHKLIAKLAQSGFAEAALCVTEAIFQVFERDGELASFFDTTMYEYYMTSAVNHLAEADPLLAIPRFSDLLLLASRMDRRLRDVKEEDYAYYAVGPLQPNQRGGGDVLSTITYAIAKLATSAVQADPTKVRRVLNLLSKYRPKIFRRIEMHALAVAPNEAPDVVDEYLTDIKLIDADWCRQEYAELAKAWFRRLPPERQKVTFDFIESVPVAHLDKWHAHLQQHEKRHATAEDDRRFCEITIRDIVWLWRDALPSDRRAALDKTVAEFGNPDAWRNGFFGRDQSPLTRASMQSQPVKETVAYLEAWRPDPDLQTHTAVGLANELREAVAARPDVFSAEAMKFGQLRPLFIRHVLDGLRQATANGARVDWGQCLELITSILKQSQSPSDNSTIIPGDDPGWSWTLRSAVEWLASALSRGADGMPFIHAEAVRAIVMGLYRRIAHSISKNEDERADRKHPYFAALQTVRGAAIDLCVLLLFWQSKDPTSAIGQAPRDTLARAQDIRAIFEEELEDRSPSGWVSRAILARYLTWLFFFGKDWVRSQMSNLFPLDSDELSDVAWLGHLQNDQAPVGELIAALHPFYVKHIASLERNDALPGYTESNSRLIDHLMILYLWEQLPEDVLQQFWESATSNQLRHAMWFIGRHMVSSNDLRTRAMSYWDRRIKSAVHATDPEPYRKELGIIGTFFLWEIDPLWLMDQLLITLNAGLGPTDAMGVIDNLAKQAPDKIDKVIEITKALVRQPRIEAWIFASEGQSLRQILLEGKKSASPLTVAAVKEIVSYLSSRGNTSFLDIDE
jgi:hypothetical protein